MADSIFKNYWNEVCSILGGKPSKSLAISLSENPPPNIDGASVVGRLHKSLACDGWKITSGKNWEWRKEAPPYRTSSPEVTLEREIVEEDILNQWTCQMSTASGIQGPRLNKRRAIDLVRKAAPGRYAFVELKVGNDNPLYAAFEILSYALAYQHARKYNCTVSGSTNVMDAREVKLIVLGPSEWYLYKKRGAPGALYKFKLDWLAKALNDGLNSITNDALRMHFSFQEFDNLGDARLTAAGITRNACEW